MSHHTFEVLIIKTFFCHFEHFVYFDLVRISENKVQLPTEINIILFYLSSVLTIFFKEGTSEVADSGKCFISGMK